MKIQPDGMSYRPMRAKLIFNPSSGAADQSPVQLMEVIRAMQSWNIVSEPYLIEPGCDLAAEVMAARLKGIQLFVVCGGDGTINSVAKALVGTRAILGIVPLGTQNNISMSLGIPTDIPAAISILRTGKKTKIDMGIATVGKVSTPFLEVCSVGLVSTLFPSADDIQHGNLARVGDFLTGLAGSPPAEIHLLLDRKVEIQNLGHVVLVSNMPYIGFHYQLGCADAYKDGLLDVLFFADLSKLDLLGYVLTGVGEGNPEDPRIQHYHVPRVEIFSQPEMPVMADGVPLEAGTVRIEVRRNALSVMVPVANKPPDEKAIHASPA
jgi:diacylglycerol kinase (ATP)